MAPPARRRGAFVVTGAASGSSGVTPLVRSAALRRGVASAVALVLCAHLFITERDAYLGKAAEPS